jgi:fructose-bisphosphate aldolase class I
MGGCSCAERNADPKSPGSGSPSLLERERWEYDDNFVSVKDVESGCGVSQADAGSDLAEPSSSTKGQPSGSSKGQAESSNIESLSVAQAKATDPTGSDIITKEVPELEEEQRTEEEPELEDAPNYSCMSDQSDEEELVFTAKRSTITFDEDEPEVTHVPSNQKRSSDMHSPKRRVSVWSNPAALLEELCNVDDVDEIIDEAEAEKVLKVKKITEQDGLFVALDSTGSAIPKALKRYGLEIADNASAEEMKKKVHEMRSRIFTNPKFSGKRVIGVMLSEQTLDCEIRNMTTAEYLWEKKGIIPFLSCHIGFEKEKDGCQLMANMSKLEKMLEHCVSKNVFGAKLHSIIRAPKLAGIKRVVEQQIRAAKMVLAKGMMPVLEPEIDMNASNKWECEEMLLDLLTSELGKLAPDQKVMLQLALPSQKHFFLPLICHPNVIRLLALSGGYDLETSCKKTFKQYLYGRLLESGIYPGYECERFSGGAHSQNLQGM